METFLPYELHGKKGGVRTASLFSGQIISKSLPAVMSEGPVRLRHPVSIFLHLEGGPATIRGFDDCSRQLFFHGLCPTVAGRLDQPPHTQREPPLRPDFNWHLIGRSAYAPRSDFDRRPGVLDGALKDAQGVFFGPARHNIEGTIENRFRNAFLSSIHDRIDELGHQFVPVLRVRQHFSFSNFSLARHSTYLGLFAPYLERPWRRSCTPMESRVPRMMWYRTPGKSFTRPPRIKTTECSCRL